MTTIRCESSPTPETLPLTAQPAAPMTPFIRVPRNVMVGMIEREVLLAQPAELFRPFFDGRIPTLAERIQFTEGAIQRMTSLHTYENNLYHVEIVYSQPFIHLNIRRHDAGSCNEWRHLQQIKNELIGPEFEAVELFPSESRLVDTSNEYHLWVHADPGYRFPFGFSTRFVLEKPLMGWLVQTPLAAAASGKTHGTDRVAHQRTSEAAA